MVSVYQGLEMNVTFQFADMFFRIYVILAHWARKNICLPDSQQGYVLCFV